MFLCHFVGVSQLGETDFNISRTWFWHIFRVIRVGEYFIFKKHFKKP